MTRERGSGSFGLQHLALDRRQGKCFRCQLVYVWPSKQCPLKRAYCPECGSKLHRTTHRILWARRHVAAVRIGAAL